ncbi:MAG: hypothetical protein GY765_05035 [bacterium]|nr:hypothetical protein [bacterium]
MTLLKKSLVLSLMVCFLLSLTMVVGAEDKKDEKKGNKYVGPEFSGGFLVGYRGVDVSGVDSKYKQDYNLDDGPRLFTLSFHYNPKGKMKKLFDRLSLHAHNLGGDPFESIHIDAVKFGKYKFDYSRRKSTYFYRDILQGHDFHHYNFERIQDSGMLKIWLNKAVRFYMDFNRYTKKGDSTTSLDISREEYEFEKPVDEESTETTIGLEIAVKRFTIVLEEKLHDYQNSNSFFLPGMSYGENMDDATLLNYFNINQPYDFRSFTHIGRVVARPVDNLLIRASAQVFDQDFRLSYSETTSGVTYLGSNFSDKYSGDAQFDRQMMLLDFDLSYLINSKFALVAAVRYHKLEQEGEMEIYNETMPHELTFNTLGLEAGLQYQVSPKMTFTLGFRNEKREVEEEAMVEETTRTGFFGNLKYKPCKKISLTGDYQYGTFDDPFTPVSPTDFHRARFTAKYKGKHCWLNASYMYKVTENDVNDGWKSENNQLSVRTGYYKKTFKLSLGYSLIYAKSEGDRNFVFYGSPSTWSIMYEGRASLFDGYLAYKLPKNWKLGCYANYYVNDGSWGLKRIVLKPFVSVNFCGGFLGQFAYRYVKFEEEIYGYNDYEANIIEVSFGYKW